MIFENRITLVPFEINDFKRLISWILNERDLLVFAGPILKFPLDEEQLQKYINDPHRFPFKIVHNLDSKVIGHLEAYKTENYTIKICRVLIGDINYRSKGYASEALKLLIDYCTNNFNTKYIELNVYDFNESAIKCYEKLGFNHTDQFQLTKFHNEEWKSIKMELILA